MSDIRVYAVTEDQAEEAAGLMMPAQAKALKMGLPITVLAAVIEDKAVGVIAGTAAYGVFDIESLYIHPDYRRQGVGKALVEKLSEYTDEMDLGLKAEYNLETEDNKTLRPFFESLDFIEDPMFFPSYRLAPLAKLNVNVRGSEALYNDAKSLYETPKDLLEAATQRSMESGFPLPDDGLMSPDIDAAMSYCVIKHDRISAYVTIEVMEKDMLKVSSVWSELNDPREMMVMLSHSIEKMKKRFAPTTRVVMLALNPTSLKLIEHVCGHVEQCSFRYIRKY